MPHVGARNLGYPATYLIEKFERWVRNYWMPIASVLITVTTILTMRYSSWIAQAIKYCHCLNYQSCEYPQWERSEAKTLLDEMRETFVRHMPGYDEAQWC